MLGYQVEHSHRLDGAHIRLRVLAPAVCIFTRLHTHTSLQQKLVCDSDSNGVCTTSGSVGKIFPTSSGNNSGASGDQYTYLAQSLPRSLPHRTEQERLEWIEYDKEVENRKKVITFIYFSDVGSVHDWRGGLINTLCFFWNEICQTLLMAFRDRCRQRARDKQLNIMRIKYATTQVCSI